MERDAQIARDVQEAEKLGVTIFMLSAQRRGPIVLPMSAYYTRDGEHEMRRATFYRNIALVFGSPGWHFSNSGIRSKAGDVGHGGRARDVQAVGRGSIALDMNAASAPLEWLASTGRLETHADPAGQRMLRFAVATSFRDIQQGAEFAGLKGQAYDGSGGGGGGAGRPVTDHMIDCVNLLIKIRASMHPGLFRTMVRTVCDDEWIWEKTSTPSDRLAIILHLHQAIDKTAVTLRYMTAADFRKRWGKFTPLWIPPKRKRKKKALDEQQPAQ
ncbi:hypothetical protein GA830_10380 [Mesorhizobium sp. NBSH29]|nr:hypothetical protein GA830_10380 [Mesorhizobium sp. NBSH29]